MLGRTLTIVAVLLALFVMTSVAAWAQISGRLAVGTGGSNLYMFSTDRIWGSSYRSIYTGGSFTAVATSGRWVYAVDATQKRLVVGKIENIGVAPVLSSVSTVSLNLAGANAIALDANGGVYITSNANTSPGTPRSYTFAHVTAPGGDWLNANVSYGVTDKLQVDVASTGQTTGFDAVIAGYEATLGRTFAEQVSGSSGTPADLSTSRYASGVAVNSSFQTPMVYVTSRDTDGLDNYGSLDVFSLNDPQTVNHYQLSSDFAPEDVVTFSVTTGGQNPVTTQYVAIIGRPLNGAAEARLYTLTSTGLPDLGTLQTRTFTGDALGGYSSAVSQDGLVYWSTHLGMKGVGSTVLAMNSTGWSGGIGDFADTSSIGVTSIAPYEYVPEASTVTGLLALLAGLPAVLRKRR